ncbi:MAG: AraC family transcriptional regulator [Bacteroidota bacterium]
MSSQTVLCTTKRDGRPAPQAGKGATILNASPQPGEMNLKGYLVRFISEGQEKFKQDGRTYYLEAGHYILLNPGKISWTIETPSQGIWAEVPLNQIKRELQNLHHESPDNWKDNIFGTKGEIQFCDHVYMAQLDELGRLLLGWKDRNSFGEASTKMLIQTLLKSQKTAFEGIGRLTSAKLSTRKELYRRLCQSQAYIHSNLDSLLDLDTLSQVACLSKYHFIRLFKEVYGETPRQYLIKQRLDKAKSLLVTSKKTFHEICHEVGLKDSSSFGRLFKRSFGATPQIYRQMHSL